MQLSSLLLAATAIIGAATAPAENVVQQTEAVQAKDVTQVFYCTPWHTYCGSTLQGNAHPSPRKRPGLTKNQLLDTRYLQTRFGNVHLMVWRLNWWYPIAALFAAKPARNTHSVLIRKRRHTLSDWGLDRWPLVADFLERPFLYTAMSRFHYEVATSSTPLTASNQDNYVPHTWRLKYWIATHGKWRYTLPF